MTSAGSLDVDSNRQYLYSTNNDSIKLYRYSTEASEQNEQSKNADITDLSYLNTIPIVRTWDGGVIKPDNLLLYQDGSKMLLSDANSYDSIMNLNIERGIITNKQPIHATFGGKNPEDVVFKVKKFDYNSHSDIAQYDSYAIGINSNHIMRFDVNSGDLVHKKGYEKNPHFSAVTTDAHGNVIVGDDEGKIRLFPDVGNKAAKCTAGYGDAITNLNVFKEDVLATTDFYFIYLPKFIIKGTSESFIGKIGTQVEAYLKISGQPMKNAQFSPNGKMVIFSIGKYLFHWAINKLMLDDKEFAIYEADKPIIQHKYSDGQFALTNTPVKFVI